MATKTEHHGLPINRVAPLLDMEVKQTANGRELTAYVAAFDVISEVVDWDGHYEESIDRTAFNRSLSQHPDYAGYQSLVNHGQDIYGMPSDRFALPYSKILEVTPDSYGLLTRVQIHNSVLGDEMVEQYETGTIIGMSFSAVAVRSEPDPDSDGPFGPDGKGGLVHVVRKELALREFGPAVFPVYQEAEVVSLRAGTLDMAPYEDGRRTLVLSEAQRAATLEEAPPTAPVDEADPEDGSNVETPTPDPSAQLRIRLQQAEILGATHESGTP